MGGNLDHEAVEALARRIPPKDPTKGPALYVAIQDFLGPSLSEREFRLREIILTGALRTQPRMASALIKDANGDVRKPFCCAHPSCTNHETIETMDHIIWHCQLGKERREQAIFLLQRISNSVWPFLLEEIPKPEDWPMQLRTHGLMPASDDMIKNINRPPKDDEWPPARMPLLGAKKWEEFDKFLLPFLANLRADGSRFTRMELAQTNRLPILDMLGLECTITSTVLGIPRYHCLNTRRPVTERNSRR